MLVDAPAAVLALVLAETAVGGLALLWLAPTWGNVRHGYEMLLGSSLALMALGAWAAMQGPLATAIDAGLAGDAPLWISRGLLAMAILAGLAVLSLAVRLSDGLGRSLGITAAAVGVATFVPVATLRDAHAGAAAGALGGVVELLLGAFLLGAVWDGLVLGHWYLVERRLSNRYMVWMAWVNVAAVVAGFGAIALSARNPVPCAGLTGAAAEACAFAFSPLLAVGSMTLILGVGVLALVALIAGFNVRLAQEGGRSIQAATGMFYLAVVLAPAAEFAAKVRFF